MQTVLRARGRALAAARPSRPSRSSSVALTASPSWLQSVGAQRAALSTSPFSSTTGQNSEFPASEFDGRSRLWAGLALAAAAMAFVASEKAADAKEPAEEKEDPKEIAKLINEQKEEVKAAVKQNETKKRTLRKRKTSVRDGKMVVSTAAVRGDRAYMEDTSYVSSCKRFAAVYDGHGGAAVSQFLRNQLFSMISPELAQLDLQILAENKEENNVAAKSSRRQKVADLLRDTVQKLDQEVIAKNEWKFQGSTAVGVLLFEDVLYSLNVGDSRAVLCRGGNTVDLTRDHKPNDPQERARIESLGGRVQWYGYVDAQGEPIEPYGAYRVNGNLAVARAIGDRDSRPFVIGEAEIRQYDIEYDKDEFIVLASDGLWDVFTSSEVVEFVQDVMSGELGGREAWSSGGHSDTRVPIFEWSQQYTSDRSMIKAARRRRKVQIANYLVQEALFRGTSDNVSVVVVWLR
ncbi:Protein phosphatase 2C [Phytophthora infestans]|uniref:Protein phosphatase 2C n=1 Tax=Phytophthora infestans TaxID=4787 RepID=A0A8S9V0C8_PHYIN|nr:Protein phosphatase 2C [Phytophthora infestans]